MSRAELFETSRAWAGVLAAEGCGPEVPVALLVPRGIDALVAILAVLRAGSGYVPLSTEDPPDRLRAILDDCGRPLVVAADETVARLGGYPGRVIALSRLRQRARAAGPADRADRPVSVDNLAFIIYTSGTTGRPKGVQGTHRQLINYALWCREAFAHRPGEWTVLHAPLAFLGSLTTIFTPLLAGWPIEIAPEGSTIDDLLALAERVPVGLLKLTPTHVRMMLARGATQRWVARQFMIGSEPLVMNDDVATWVKNHPAATYVNHYGLTEAHGCFCHRFTADAPIGQGVPIGAPIANVRAHIVDEHGDDVPPGECGELLVAGDSIGRGYHAKPALTAQRWIPDRWSASGGRALRTGDLARLRADGYVEVLGRADRQLKVRGHRVEPGAVEEALRSLPEVLEALVLPRDENGVTTLAAYVIARPGARVDPVAAHRALSERLPAPCVPARMSVLREFPMNANGKVDAAALPPAEPIRPAGADTAGRDTAGGDTAGRGRWTRYDRIVADAFSEWLSIDAIGLDDSFFDLGGDSLGAVQVAVALGEALGAEVPVPTPEYPTVRAYAEVVAGADAPDDLEAQ
jgi:amino acid adenylation domain-containing protein